MRQLPPPEPISGADLAIGGAALLQGLSPAAQGVWGPDAAVLEGLKVACELCTDSVDKPVYYLRSSPGKVVPTAYPFRLFKF